MKRSPYHKSLDEHIDEMRAAANQLVDYSIPNVPVEDAKEIDVLKRRQVVVDGYGLALGFSIREVAKRRIHRIETLQIVGVYVPFLPMYLVCKVGAKFLGIAGLKYAEGFGKGRKVYTWTVGVDKRGRPVKLTNPKLEQFSYDDFTFSSLKSELL